MAISLSRFGLGVFLVNVAALDCAIPQSHSGEASTEPPSYKEDTQESRNAEESEHASQRDEASIPGAAPPVPLPFEARPTAEAYDAVLAPCGTAEGVAPCRPLYPPWGDPEYYGLDYYGSSPAVDQEVVPDEIDGIPKRSPDITDKPTARGGCRASERLQSGATKSDSEPRTSGPSQEGHFEFPELTTADVRASVPGRRRRSRRRRGRRRQNVSATVVTPARTTQQEWLLRHMSEFVQGLAAIMIALIGGATVTTTCSTRPQLERGGEGTVARSCAAGVEEANPGMCARCERLTHPGNLVRCPQCNFNFCGVCITFCPDCESIRCRGCPCLCTNDECAARDGATGGTRHLALLPMPGSILQGAEEPFRGAREQQQARQHQIGNSLCASHPKLSCPVPCELRHRDICVLDCRWTRGHDEGVAHLCDPCWNWWQLPEDKVEPQQSASSGNQPHSSSPAEIDWPWNAA